MTTSPLPAPPRAFRSSDDRWIGGVAGGLADHLRLTPLAVRLGFVGLAVLGGLGVAFYAGLWLMLPVERSGDRGLAPGLAAATRQGKRQRRESVVRDGGLVLAIVLLGVGLLLFLQILVGFGGMLWPVVIALGGLALIWRQADEAAEDRQQFRGAFGPVRALVGQGGAAAYVRVGVGVVLLLLALVLFAARTGQVGMARDVLLTALLAVLGLGLVLAPWVVRLVGDLTSERTERIRSQERADMAAHLHDSVLQTLALIQKHAADERAVATLARGQERDLRSWLYGDAVRDSGTLAAELRRAAAEVEDGHGVPVEVVVVGDCPVDERVRPVVPAAREAMVNAAKHADVPRIDVYAEIVADVVEVFVRDRGSGFDPDAVAEDRLGVRSSIIGRMERHGGAAEVRSTPGSGTEVRLRMPRSPGTRTPESEEQA